MSKEKPLTHVTATRTHDDNYNLIPYVTLYATLSWLKGGPLGSARLSARQARSLAKNLLIIADYVDPGDK